VPVARVCFKEKHLLLESLVNKRKQKKHQSCKLNDEFCIQVLAIYSPPETLIGTSGTVFITLYIAIIHYKYL
jgi:hypothetical protein